MLSTRHSRHYHCHNNRSHVREYGATIVVIRIRVISFSFCAPGRSDMLSKRFICLLFVEIIQGLNLNNTRTTSTGPSRQYGGNRGNVQRKWDERGRVDKQKVDDCESDSKFSDMLGKCVNEYDVRQRGFASDTQTIYYADLKL